MSDIARALFMIAAGVMVLLAQWRKDYTEATFWLVFAAWVSND